MCRDLVSLSNLPDRMTVDAHDGPATDTGQLESLGP